MFRQRNLTDLDAVNSSLHYVFEFGIIRVQEPNPIEFLIQKVNKKFVFSDHKAEKEKTWVYISHVANDAETQKTAFQIAESEGFGRFLGSYIIDQEGKASFRPADSMLPSQAVELLKKGVDEVNAGKWKNTIS